MKKATNEYRRRVWEFLEKIPHSKYFEVAKQCKIENTEIFINAIKEYMESFPYQGYVCFNHDYSKFYKSTPLNDIK